MKLTKVLIALALALPLAGAKAITFTSDTFIGVGDTTYDGQGIAVSNCTLTVDGPHAFASLRVDGAGVVTHPLGDASGVGSNRVQLTIAGDVTIAAGATISVDGRGYPGVAGPGVGGNACDCWWVGGGGGHGGLGGSSGCGAGGAAYGSALEPTTWGSGGGRSCNPTLGAGRGGGAIRLIVSGTLTLDGQINARGTEGSSESGGPGGGGAGGSVWITAAHFAGAGNLVANGGGGAWSGDRFLGGGGAGGRVAIYFGAWTFTGTVSAQGGVGFVPGGAGPVFTKSSAQSVGTLLVNNGGQPGALTPLTSPERFHLTLTGGTRLYPEAPLQVGDLSLGEGCSIYRPGGDAPPASPLVEIAANGNGVLASNTLILGNCRLTVQGNLLIASGAVISVDALGYPGKTGPSAGAPSCDTYWLGGGGGHGAWGGSSGCGAGGTAYGSIMEPSTWGSGGGRPANPTITAGSGGGAIRLIVGGALTLDGQLTARGEDGISYPGGGGAGGSVWVSAGSLAGAGSINAAGGAANASPPGAGGGGAGGRIAAYFGSTTFTGAMTATGGNGWTPGGAGSVFTKNITQPLGTLVVDNAGRSGAITPVTSAERFNLTIKSASRVEPTAPLVVGDLLLASGCQIYQPGRAEPYAVQIAASGNVVLESNTLIYANTFLTVQSNLLVPAGAILSAAQNGYGYPYGAGLGQGEWGKLECPNGFCSTGGAGGGGHGNFGQAGGVWPVAHGGIAYGSVQEPSAWGSAGGLGDWMHRWPDAGGLGGGAWRIAVGGTATLDGSLTVEGGYCKPDSGGGGGGAAGSVWLTAARLEGSGPIVARGGAGYHPDPNDNWYCGAGAGGRVAVYCSDTNGFTGLIQGVDPAEFIPGPLMGSLFRAPTSVGTSVIAVAPTNQTAGAVAFIRVTFRQAVRAGSFTGDDVVFTTPSGVVPSAQLAVVQVAPLVFDIRCPMQTTLGQYTVQIGPHIEDLYGHEMGYLSTSTFTLTLLKLTASFNGTSIRMQWPTGLAHSYQLQSTENFSQPSWVNVGLPVTGTGGLVTADVPINSVPAKFFRLQVED